MDYSPGYTDSPECDRNPSPPPELTENPELLLAESVGNTAFSKHWLFSTLIKLIEEVDRENEEDSNLAVDVDEELQNELCKLWDMSMNSDVAKFLNEFKAVEILSGIIEKSKAPRVIEISVGILGNMACERSVCMEMAENSKFMAKNMIFDEIVEDEPPLPGGEMCHSDIQTMLEQFKNIAIIIDSDYFDKVQDLLSITEIKLQQVLLLMETRDVPTLVENTRLIYTSLSGTGSRETWIKAIQRSEDFLNHLMFIFSSSTNCDLLKNSAELVDILLDNEADLCVSWATIEFIHSLLEATDQIGSGHTEAFEVYLHIFQSYSTSESGVEALVAHIERLEMKIIKYLNIVCEYEIVALGGKEEPLASALSVLHISLTSRTKDKLGHLCRDESIMRILLKILEPLYPMLKKYKEAAKTNINQQTDEEESNKVTEIDGHVASRNDQNSSEVKQTESQTADEENAEFKQLEVLYDILSSFLLEYCCVAFETPDKTNEEEEKSVSNLTTETATKRETDQSQKDSGDNLCSDKENIQDNIAGDNETSETRRQEEVNAEEKDEVKDSVPILTYLDEACSRWRINNLALTLKESVTGRRLFSRILYLSKHHNKERLCRILNDVSAGRIVNRAESSKELEDNTT